MEAGDIKGGLLGLEHRFWRAIQGRDFATAVELVDFPCIIAGPQGVMRVSRSQFEGMMKAESSTIESYEIDEAKAEVERIGEDVAVIAYTVKMKSVVDGKPVDLEAAEVSVWRRRDGKWVCGQHVESLLGDPWGRDRQRAEASAA